MYGPPGLEGRSPRNSSRHGLLTAFPLESWLPGSAARIVARLRTRAVQVPGKSKPNRAAPSGTRLGLETESRIGSDFKLPEYSSTRTALLRTSALLEILMRVPGPWFQVPFSFSNYLFCLLCKLFWTRGWSAGRTVVFSGARAGLCCFLAHHTVSNAPRKSVSEKFYLHHEQSEEYPLSSKHLAHYIPSSFILIVFIVYQ